MCFFFLYLDHFNLILYIKLIMEKTKKNQSTKTWDVVPELGQYEVRYKGNLLPFFFLRFSQTIYRYFRTILLGNLIIDFLPTILYSVALLMTSKSIS